MPCTMIRASVLLVMGSAAVLGEDAKSFCVQPSFDGNAAKSWPQTAYERLKAKYESRALTLTTDSGWTVALRFCPEDGMVLKATKKDAKTLVLARNGDANKVGVSLENGSLLKLAFGGADKASNCSKDAALTVLLAICAKGSADDVLTLTTNKDLSKANGHVFTLASSLVCHDGKAGAKASAAPKAADEATTKALPAAAATPQAKAPPPAAVAGGRGSHSASGTLATIAAVGALAYFLCAFLYKRVVMGAQGAEQIPHYFTLRRIARVFQDKAEGIRRGSFVPAGGASREESREFHPNYDQLPPSAPQRRSGEESDADDRLLQV